MDIDKIVKYLENFIKEIPYEERLILGYNLTQQLLSTSAHTIYAYNIFEKHNCGKDIIEYYINYVINNYKENNKDFIPFNFIALEILLILKYLSLKDRIKVIYTDYIYIDFNDKEYPIAQLTIEEDKKEFEEIKKQYSYFFQLIEEKEKDLEFYEEKHLIEKYRQFL